MANPYNLGLAAWLAGAKYNTSPGQSPLLVALGGIGNSDRPAEISVQLQLEALADVLDAILIALGGAVGANSLFRVQDLDNTAQSISVAPCGVYGWNIINPTATTVYVKFVNLGAGVIVGTTPLVTTLAVPAGGSVYQDVAAEQYNFSVGCSVYATLSLPDSSTDAPSTELTIDITFR